MGIKGFFKLSTITNWLSEMLITLNPPLRRLERVPVRVTVTKKELRK